MLNPKQLWRKLGISKKLYIVIGVMATLILSELCTLSFAMTTLSSLRSFINGESLWSKAQKDAVINLHKYVATGDEVYYTIFLKNMEVPMGDHKARVELYKPHPEMSVVFQGFVEGRNNPADVPGLITLLQRFHSVIYVHEAVILWGRGDEMTSDLITASKKLHSQMKQGYSSAEISDTLEGIDSLNDQLTQLEAEFSATLGAGSRWMEKVLMISLLLVVLTVESTGLILTIRFARTLSSGLNELNVAASEVGQGRFEYRVPVRSEDELGQLALSINKMASDLESHVDQKAQAENASKLKSHFLANMSHEIRTPLGAMLGFAELLRDPSLTEAEREQYISIIQHTGQSLTKIISDILDLSKVEAGHMQIEKSAFSLRSLLEELRLMIEVRRGEKPVEIIFHPQGFVPDQIFTDPLRLRQILMNLLGNAIKFTDKGWIRMTYMMRNSKLVFRIQDTGAGVSEEKKSLLFQPFSQVDSSASRRHQGTGLGLVLSRELAQKLGGEVQLLHSVLGEGSLFEVEIAVESAVRREEPLPTPVLAMASGDDISLVGKKLLLVEDSSINRLLFQQILRKQGAQLQLATNGAEGVEQALHDDFDAVLMDIQMPVMDGYDATRELRSRGYQGPIIALTANAMSADRARCLEAGCDDYLTKPIDRAQLLRTLAEYTT